MTSERHTIIELSLTGARTDEQFDIKGEQIIVIGSNPNAPIGIKLEHTRSGMFPMEQLHSLNIPFNRFFLTHGAIGGTIKLLIFDEAGDYAKVTQKLSLPIPEIFEVELIENPATSITYSLPVGYRYKLRSLELEYKGDANTGNRDTYFNVRTAATAGYLISPYYGWVATAGNSHLSVFGYGLEFSQPNSMRKHFPLPDLVFTSKNVFTFNATNIQVADVLSVRMQLERWK